GRHDHATDETSSLYLLPDKLCGRSVPENASGTPFRSGFWHFQEASANKRRVGSFKAIISLFMATPPLRGGNESPALAEALEAHCFSRRKQTSARSRPNMTQKRALPRYRQPGSVGH